MPEAGRGFRIYSRDAPLSGKPIPDTGPGYEEMKTRRRSRKPQGRVCANCDTILSIYNLQPICGPCWTAAGAKEIRVCAWCSQALGYDHSGRKRFCSEDCKLSARKMRLHA